MPARRLSSVLSPALTPGHHVLDLELSKPHQVSERKRRTHSRSDDPTWAGFELGKDHERYRLPRKHLVHHLLDLREILLVGRLHTVEHGQPGFGAGVRVDRPFSF